MNDSKFSITDNMTTVSCSPDETRMLNNISNGMQYKYDIFFWKDISLVAAKETASRFRELTQKYTQLYCTYSLLDNSRLVPTDIRGREAGFVLRNLSDFSELEKKHRIESEIINVRSAIYDPKRMLPMYVTVLKYSESNYITIFSLCQALKEYFIVDIVKKYIIPEKLHSEIRKYPNGFAPSQSILSELLSEAPMPLERLVGYKVGSLTEEIYDLGLDLGWAIRNEIKYGKFSVEAICIATWGILINKIANTDNCMQAVYLDDENDNLYPVISNRQEDFIVVYNEVVGQLEKLEKSLGFTEEKLKSFFSCDVSEMIPIVHNFSGLYSMHSVEECCAGELRCVSALPVQKTAMVISYYNGSEGVSVKYSYDRKLFADINVATLNETFISMLRSILDIVGVGKKWSYDDTDLSRIGRDEGSNEARILKEKRSILMQQKLFEYYVDYELERLADLCELESYQYGEKILQGGLCPDAMYIAVKGHVEECQMSFMDQLMPLRILRPKDIFGLEVFMDGQTITNSYYATDDIVEVLRIPMDGIKELAEMNPNIYLAVINILYRRVASLEKLWLNE